VVEKVRGRLSVSKQAAQKFYVERFNLKKLNDLEVKEQYQVKIFAALQRCGGGGIKRAWESIRENMKLQPQTV
jgi:hypothetical protein